MVEILMNAGLETLYIVGGLMIFGLVLDGLNRFAVNNYIQSFGTRSLLVTGWIGTPVHELSHAILCVLFMHQITGIKLFQKPDANGVMGYVNHRYNPVNLYAQIGNFFIAVAPLLGGTLCILGLMFLFLPDAAGQIAGLFSQGWTASALSVSGLQMIFLKIGEAIFTMGHLTDFRFYVFLFLALCIASHIALSTADLKGSLPGIAAIFLLFLLVNLLVGQISGFSGWFMTYNTVVICLLMVSVVLSVANAAVSLVLHLVF
jgi:hypothetical protein